MSRPWALVALALSLTACAPLQLSRSAATPTPAPHPSALAIAQRTHEYPSPPVAQTATTPARGPVSAVRRFATAYINWTARTVSGDMTALAQESVGQARSAMQLAAAQTAQDAQLREGGIANQGTVQAVAPRAAHPNQYVVVTLERTTATATTAYTGLAPAWHVTVATVTELAPGRWVLSGWQPES